MRKFNVKASMTSRNSTDMSNGQRGSHLKRVAPPLVPDVYYRHSGSSFSSAGYGSAEENPSLTPLDTDDEVKSPGGTSAISFQFPPSQRILRHSCGGEPLTHKAAVYYHQQLALPQGQTHLDVNNGDIQSPGRDSPGSSSGSAGSGSRHSTASLDSGRASSYLTGSSSSGGSGLQIQTGVGRSYATLNSPRSSSVGSSSSIAGSVEHIGSRDASAIFDWLQEMRFEEYAINFISAGYDLGTIQRMTPEDLTAIGIKNPQHREKIKYLIDNTQFPDPLPHYVPGSIEEWLRLLRLEEYIGPILAQGYETVHDVTQLTWEDLEDIGIVKLGHQKKILLAIKRVRDINSGKLMPNTLRPTGTNNVVMYNTIQQQQPASPNEIVQIKLRDAHSSQQYRPRLSAGLSSFEAPNYALLPQQQQEQLWRQYRSLDDGDITPTNEAHLYGPIHNTQQGGGTLPRQNVRYHAIDIMEQPCQQQIIRPRPIANIVPLQRAVAASTVAPISSSCGNLWPDDLKPTPVYANLNSLAVVEVHQEADHNVMTSHKSPMTASSTDSIDAIPFANDNAGTIKSTKQSCAPLDAHSTDVLTDIGDMLATLTDELDAMLEKEKLAGIEYQ